MTNNSGGGRGGLRPGSGRKPKHAQPADKRLMVRLTADQFEKLLSIAGQSGVRAGEQLRLWLIEKMG